MRRFSGFLSRGMPTEGGGGEEKPRSQREAFFLIHNCAGSSGTGIPNLWGREGATSTSTIVVGATCSTYKWVVGLKVGRRCQKGLLGTPAPVTHLAMYHDCYY